MSASAGLHRLGTLFQIIGCISFALAAAVALYGSDGFNFFAAACLAVVGTGLRAVG